MKRLAMYTFLIIVCCFYNLSAQDSTKHILQKGSFAFQYQVSGLSLRDFQGSLLSCKYHIRDNYALRFGASLSSTLQLENKINTNDLIKGRYLSFTLNLQMINYLNTMDNVLLYFGTGPYFSRYFNESESGSYYFSKSWSLGLNNVIGIEWFFRNNMSLSGEYGHLVYYTASENINSDNFNYHIRKQFDIHSDQVKLGLSIYL